jgi:hypothetical protein
MERPADTYAMFETNVLMLEFAIRALEEKARRYFAKVQKAREEEEELQRQLKEKQRRVMEKENPKMTKKKKMHGVAIIDSDEDEDWTTELSSVGHSLDFSDYKYNDKKKTKR